MRKERETLVRDLGIQAIDGFFYIKIELQAEIRELLTQKPEQEPLSYSRTADLFHANREATNAVCYWAGVSDAEKAHGIGEN
jgi:hypothetical protein